MAQAAERLLSLMTGTWISQSVYAGVRTGVLDVLGETPRSTAEIAKTAECDEQAVSRLLRHLSGLGLAERNAEDAYTATSLTRLLQPGGNFRDLVVFYGEDCYSAWAHVANSVRTGGTGWLQEFGQEQFEHFGADALRARRFDRAMAACAQIVARELCNSYDFSGVSHVVDIGGGNGELLKSVLEAAPRTTGCVVDRDHVAEELNREFADHSLKSRLTAVPGDFFERLPEDGDLYLLSRVLHDWDDVQCERLLDVCRAAMSPGDKLLIIERLLPDDDSLSLASWWDMQMLVVTGGRERSRSEYVSLLEGAGMRCTSVRPLALGTFLLEAVLP